MNGADVPETGSKMSETTAKGTEQFPGSKESPKHKPKHKHLVEYYHIMNLLRILQINLINKQSKKQQCQEKKLVIKV